MATLVIHIRNHKKKVKNLKCTSYTCIYIFYTEVKRVIIKKSIQQGF